MKKKLIIKKLREDRRNEIYTSRGINPVFQLNPKSKMLIIGQAPGERVEETGILFSDKSRGNLVKWLGISGDILHSEDFSIIPMDFHYPGKGKSGDKAPRSLIAREYHPLLLNELKDIKLVISIGAYAQKFYLKDKFKRNLTETVKFYKEFLPEYLPIVHPNPLNNRWVSKNPFFREEVLLELKKIVKELR